MRKEHKIMFGFKKRSYEQREVDKVVDEYGLTADSIKGLVVFKRDSIEVAFERAVVRLAEHWKFKSSAEVPFIDHAEFESSIFDVKLCVNGISITVTGRYDLATYGGFCVSIKNCECCELEAHEKAYVMYYILKKSEELSLAEAKKAIYNKKRITEAFV